MAMCRICIRHTGLNNVFQICSRNGFLALIVAEDDQRTTLAMLSRSEVPRRLVDCGVACVAP